MEIIINNNFVEQYVKDNKRHAAYKKTVDIANHLRFHIDGYTEENDNPYFKKLIEERRPSESETIKRYRKSIYTPKTKEPCFKVLNSLKKIVKSQDWKIDYSKVEPQSKIRKGEELEVYAERNYPIYKSIENWLYSYAFQQVLSDPNGLIVVTPMSYDVKATDFLKPVASFIKSENVYDYVEDQYAVIQTSTSADFVDDSGKFAGKEYVILILTTTEIWECRKINTRGEYKTTMVYKHNIGKLPAFRAGGTHLDIIDNAPVYDSFISPIIPGLDKAAREDSDMDAEVVQHIFSTMWYMSGQDCSVCNGAGRVILDGNPTVCGSCKGAGSMPKSPYTDIVIKSSELDQKQVPTPPAGYIQKNTDIVKIQDERIQNHIYRALSAVNMEYLASTPLNQSGKAKEVDRDELNNFVYGVAYHVVENIINPIYYFTIEYRYLLTVPDAESRLKLMPIIPVPQRFDILTENIIGDQLAQARTAKVDPTIVSELEVDYVTKKFNNNPDVRDRLLAVKKLDPFPSKDYTQKASESLTGFISKKDAIKSAYINTFVERAIQEEKDFLKMEYADQVKIIDKYAEEKTKEINGKSEMQNQIDAGNN